MQIQFMYLFRFTADGRRERTQTKMVNLPMFHHHFIAMFQAHVIVLRPIEKMNF